METHLEKREYQGYYFLHRKSEKIKKCNEFDKFKYIVLNKQLSDFTTTLFFMDIPSMSILCDKNLCPHISDHIKIEDEIEAIETEEKNEGEFSSRIKIKSTFFDKIIDDNDIIVWIERSSLVKFRRDIKINNITNKKSINIFKI